MLHQGRPPPAQSEGALPPSDRLALVSVFKQLTPTSQLRAALMSDHCAALVRRANRRAGRRLVVTSWDPATSQSLLRPFSLYSKPSMSELPEPFILSSSALSRFHCLQLSELWPSSINLDNGDTAGLLLLANSIADLFPALTELKVLTTAEHFEAAISVLSQPRWSETTTTTTSETTSGPGLSSLLVLAYHYWASEDEAGRLFAAINRLRPQLTSLALDWQCDRLPPPPSRRPLLSGQLLAGLDLLAVNLLPRHTNALVCSLHEVARAVFRRSNGDRTLFKDHFEVHLLCNGHDRSLLDRYQLPGLVRYGKLPLRFAYDRVVDMLWRYPSLRSISITGITQRNLAWFFDELSARKELLHLELEVDLSGFSHQDMTLARAHPGRWLNLWQTLPGRLQVLNLSRFTCKGCTDAGIEAYFNDYALSEQEKEAMVVGCFRQSLAWLPESSTAASILVNGSALKGSPFEETVFNYR
ncbi:hypothetical protein TYRP_016318 [Tyrophagus putrescentiae]|nr:hypothetical protein TYRP_016318 [Tyrophagus putrescentiae]